jgi:membrane protease YdiL (CAAX protease family)
MELLRWLGPLGLAVLAALGVDHLMSARGLLPPGFRLPWRRTAAFGVLTIALYLGVTSPLGQVGRPLEIDYSAIHPVQLFTLHGVLLAAAAAWFSLGFVVPGSLPSDLGSVGRTVLGQLGFSTPRPMREIALGLGAALLLWPAVIVALLTVAAILWMLGQQELLPSTPPPMIEWIVTLPVVLRIAISLSAGVVEELFFRGFLQPRVGIGFSSLLFVLAHLSYDEPFMLVGIALLSLAFAGLVAWRQNVWPAIVAHAVFDGVQLLILIPWAVERWQGEVAGATAFVVGG